MANLRLARPRIAQSGGFLLSVAQAPPQANKRRSNNWPKGVSGNPLGGAILKARNEAQKARQAELRAAVAAEFAGKLTTLEAVLADQAADALERAERGGDNNNVRLVRLALQLIEGIRQGRKEREAAKPTFSAFDEYVQQKAAAR
jgi:hypothetical protein